MTDLRTLILNANDKNLSEIHVPEWGVNLWLRGWSGKERAAFQQAYSQAKTDEEVANLSGLVVALTVCNDQGQRIFQIEDVELLNEKSATALDRVVNAALQHNGITKTAIEDAKKN